MDSSGRIGWRGVRDRSRIGCACHALHLILHRWSLCPSVQIGWRECVLVGIKVVYRRIGGARCDARLALPLTASQLGRLGFLWVDRVAQVRARSLIGLRLPGTVRGSSPLTLVRVESWIIGASWSSGAGDKASAPARRSRWKGLRRPW